MKEIDHEYRKWIIAHFSPTGGTKKAVDAIAAGFGAPVVEMDLIKADIYVKGL